MDISPEAHNIDRLFANTPYYIDFYQRQYKWSEPEVSRLLEDIFHKFNLSYDPSLEPKIETVMTRYGWYYLNTYITNKPLGKTYIVDGQQRLTTLSLMLIKLFHMTATLSKPARSNWVRSKIVGDSAEGEEYWMGHGSRRAIYEQLFTAEPEGAKAPADYITGRNLVKNYALISTYLNAALSSP